MALHQYDYIFAIGTIFAFLDAWNIGANDVANSWATSVSSRSISYIQAMSLGSILEFAGSVGVGARVADTIRTKIVDIDLFENDPALLMLGMCCAVTASAIYLTICTKIGLPVSTTHSIMGGVIGMGVTFNDAETAGMIIGVGAAWALLITIFFVPWLYRMVVKDDWQLRWYHIFLGPLLLRRPEPPCSLRV
ncbi:phosphate-repressible Na+/phosphate cotransporter Pho89, putative [Colletotrichum tofieldiae]|nr:phosphate-repressible Na+/phosphate cotransporter Pho89, putative [Colletotrichum tofieldiae]